MKNLPIPWQENMKHTALCVSSPGRPLYTSETPNEVESMAGKSPIWLGQLVSGTHRWQPEASPVYSQLNSPNELFKK